MSPTISVVLPFRNAAGTLAVALASIQEQSFPDFEFLLFDDGSVDTSWDIALQAAAEDRRIRIVGHERAGIVAALQRLCAQATGEFIARMDADDVSYPARFVRQCAFMRENPEVSLCGCHVAATGEPLGEGGRRHYDWLNSLTDHSAIAREIFVECPIAHPAFFMRRNAYAAVGGYRDCGWAEDYDLILRLWQSGARFGNVPDRLLEWRNTTDRLSLTGSRYSLERFRSLKRHYLNETVLPLIGRRQFIQWGAGEVGKRWLREWKSVRPRAVVDIHPRKIGTRIHDYPVIAAMDLLPPDEVYILVAVGAPGARDAIRAWLDPRGYREERDYRFIA